MKYLRQIKEEYDVLSKDQQLKLWYGFGLSVFAIVLGVVLL